MRKLPGVREMVSTSWARPPRKLDIDFIKKFSATIKKAKITTPLVGIIERENFDVDAPWWVYYYLRQYFPKMKVALSLWEKDRYDMLKGHFDFLIVPDRTQYDWLLEYRNWKIGKRDPNTRRTANWFLEEAEEHLYRKYVLQDNKFTNSPEFGHGGLHLYLFSARNLKTLPGKENEALSHSYRKRIYIDDVMGIKGFLLRNGIGKNEYLTIERGRFTGSSNRDPAAEIEYMDGYIHTTDDNYKLAIIEKEGYKRMDFESISTLDFKSFWVKAAPETCFTIKGRGGGYGKFFITAATKDRVDFIYQYIPETESSNNSGTIYENEPR